MSKKLWIRLMEDCRRLGVQLSVNQLIRLVEKGSWTDDEIVDMASGGDKVDLKKLVAELVDQGMGLDEVFYEVLSRGIQRSPATIRSVYYKVLGNKVSGTNSQ